MAATENLAAQATTAPREEHLKVEQGAIFFRLPGKAWNNGISPANVGNAVKALRALYPDATFAVDPRVAELPLTDLVIRANELNTDLWALRTACGGGFDLGGDGSLHLLQHNKSTEFNASKSGDRKIECFNLTGYLERMKKSEENKREPQTEKAIAELQSIIENTIKDFDDTIAAPHFRFHPQAQLLIVTGSQRAIEVAARVIHALPGQQSLFGYMFDHGEPSNQQSWQEGQGNFGAGAGTTSAYSILPAPVRVLDDPTAAKP
jgi:hypothetical protein